MQITEDSDQGKWYLWQLSLVIFYQWISLPAWFIASSGLFMAYGIIRRGTQLPYVHSAIFGVVAIGFVIFGMSEKASSFLYFFQITSTVFLLYCMIRPMKTYLYKTSLVLCFLLLMLQTQVVETNFLLLLVFIDFIVITWMLYAIQEFDRQHIDLRRFTRTIGKTMLQISPLVIVVFIILPQFTKSWRMNFKYRYGQTGLSDMLKPGQIARLTRNHQLAFLGEGPLGLNSDLYWRVESLGKTNGMVWSRHQKIKQAKSKQVEGIVHGEYKIFPQRKQDQRMVGPDFPLTIKLKPDKWQRLQDGSARFINKERVTYKIHFGSVKSSITMPDKGYLEFNPTEAPRAAQLGRKLRQEKGNKLKHIVHALRKEVRRGFTYSMSPGTYSDHSLDKFWFQRKVGYCEHFSASVAWILRAAGFHTRVVIGYLGGDYQPVGSFYAVYSRDAHAWLEVFDPQPMKWVRVDPTTWIAPERILLGSDYFKDQEAQWLSYMPELIRQPLRILGQQSRAMSAYGILVMQEQLSLLYEVDLFEWILPVFTEATWMIGIILCAAGIWLFNGRERLNTNKLINDYILILENAGFSRNNGEGYYELMERYLLRSPNQEKLHRHFVQHWLEAHYGPRTPDRSKLIQLKSMLQKLNHN